MAEQEQNRFTKRRLELKRRREQVKKIKMQLVSLFFVLLLACGIGLFCRHLILQQETREMQAAAELARQAAAASQEAADMIVIPQEKTVIHWAEEDILPLRLYYSVLSGTGEWNRSQRENAYSLAPEGSHLSAVSIRLESQPEGMSGTLEYASDVEGTGWTDWRSNGEAAGSEHPEQGITAFRARFTGDMELYYDLYYSVLQENIWSGWVKNGETAGTLGALQGIRVTSIRKADEGRIFPGGVDPSRPMIALTYDDGPSRNATPRILATLANHNARATFFMVASRIEKNTDIVRQMTVQGSEVGNHTFNHIAMNKASSEDYAAQLLWANQAIFDAGGASPILMRPCEGVVTAPGMATVGSYGMSAILWTVDTRDWKTRDAAQTVEAVLSQVKDGDIVLMHDLYDPTADATDILVPELISRGYQLVTVSELAAYRGGIQSGGKYFSFRPAP